MTSRSTSRPYDGSHSLDSLVICEVEAFIADASVSCTGPKSALSTNALHIVICRDMKCDWDDLRIHAELLDWMREYRKGKIDPHSLAIVFRGPDDFSEAEFEKYLRERIQALADKGSVKEHPCDSRANSELEHPYFSVSFGGKALYAVGLHRNAPRPTQRAPYSMLVFNLYDPFGQLRHEGRYNRNTEVILKRVWNFSGGANPMLALDGWA